MAVILDGIGLVVGLRGVVHDHHVVILEVDSDMLLIEAQRGVFLGRENLAVGISESVLKGGGRCAKVEAEETVNSL